MHKIGSFDGCRGLGGAFAYAAGNDSNTPNGAALRRRSANPAP